VIALAPVKTRKITFRRAIEGSHENTNYKSLSITKGRKVLQYIVALTPDKILSIFDGKN
jgi:hypothetical protein